MKQPKQNKKVGLLVLALVFFLLGIGFWLLLILMNAVLGG